MSHPLPPALNDLIAMVRSKYGAIAVRTREEARFGEFLAGALQQQLSGHLRALSTWSVTEGLRRVQVPGGEAPQQLSNEERERTKDPLVALGEILRTPEGQGMAFVMHDLHPWLRPQTDGGAKLIRRLREVAQTLRQSNNILFLVGPTFTLPADLEKEVTLIDFPLPSRAEMDALIAETYQHWLEYQKQPGSALMPNDFSPELCDALARACSGLTKLEAEDAVSRTVLEHGFNRRMLRALHDVKQEAIRQTRCLEAVPVDQDFGAVGGLDLLKDWARRYRNVFSTEAAEFGAEPPKGIMTLGVPGGGKSLSARALAASWSLPLLRLDFGAVFGGLVGESETNVREALRIVEAVAPVVLWVDEADKAFAGVQGSGSNDSGTTLRVFGSILTWMQECRAPVVCYFTANDISRLPGPLLRRLDARFFVDLPTAVEREQIFAIHLAKRKRDPKHFDLPRLAAASRGYVGGEIEQAVKQAIVDTFAAGQPTVTDDHVLAALAKMVPISITQSEEMKGLRRYAEEGRAMRASSGEPEPLPTAQVPGLGLRGSLGTGMPGDARMPRVR